MLSELVSAIAGLELPWASGSVASLDWRSLRPYRQTGSEHLSEDAWLYWG